MRRHQAEISARSQVALWPIALPRRQCRPRAMSRYLAATIATIATSMLSLAASAFFFLAWYERYLRWDFNELGRHYDAQTQTVYTTSGFVWALPAHGFLLLAAWLVVRALRRSRRRKAAAARGA
jgi:hypothetical protein